MFYLTKFCRICVKPGNRLLELSRQDYDRVTFEEKLQACTKMVVAKEDPSPHICSACVRKLRISYDFRDMCMKSDGIIRGYLAELLGSQNDCKERFENSELRIVVSPIPRVTLKIEMDKYIDSISNKENNSANVEVPNTDSSNQNEDVDVDVKPDITSILFQNLQYGNRHTTHSYNPGIIVKREFMEISQESPHSLENRVTSPLSKTKDTTTSKKKRVSKDQRCSLLRKFLSNTGPKSTIASYAPKGRRHMPPPIQQNKKRGGLKDLLGFIKGYDFGYDVKSAIEQQQETPLYKLENFSKTFFYSDFTAYRNTILAVIKSNETEASDDDMFNPFDEEEDRRLWFGNIKHETLEESEQHTFLEPDPSLWSANIKQEPGMEQLYLEQPDVHIKTELVDENDDEEANEYLPSELVQACYSEDSTQNMRAKTEDNQNNSLLSNYKYNGEYSPSTVPTLNNNFPGCYPSTSGVPSSLEMLQRFTNWAKRGGRKVISPNSLKCRTRGRPFINPQLMEQFKSRSFKCDKCHRSFKSLGYLQSHCTKMGH